MSRADRNPMSYTRLAEGLVQRGRLQGQPAALAPTLAAALRAEVALAERRGMRSRFLLRNGQAFLTEWLLPTELVRVEENTARSADRQRELARKALLARVNELPVAGFAELVATWLNGEGVTSLRAVRRPGSGPQEFHFAGTRRRGPEEERLAIVVLRGARDIDRESVVRVRGALHHYGNATASWVITTGRLSSGARDEAGAVGASSVTLFDGMELAAAMEAVGIGLRVRTVEIAELDFDLIEALGGDLHLPQAREPREPREGRDDRDRRRRRRGVEQDQEENGGRHEDAVESTDDSEGLDVDPDSDSDEDSDTQEHIRPSDAPVDGHADGPGSQPAHSELGHRQELEGTAPEPHASHEQDEPRRVPTAASIAAGRSGHERHERSQERRNGAMRGAAAAAAAAAGGVAAATILNAVEAEPEEEAAEQETRYTVRRLVRPAAIDVEDDEDIDDDGYEEDGDEDLSHDEEE